MWRYLWIVINSVEKHIRRNSIFLVSLHVHLYNSGYIQISKGLMIRVYREEEVHQIYQIRFIWICLPFVNHSEIIYPNCENKINKIYRGCLSDIVGTHYKQKWSNLDWKWFLVRFVFYFIPSFLYSFHYVIIFFICGHLLHQVCLTTPISKSIFFLFILLFIWVPI